MAPTSPTTPTTKPLQPLRGVRILSLALNVPGPMALLRLRAMGARCTKVEPPAGDPMQHYNPKAYAEIHQGVKVMQLDLRTEAAQKALDRQLARTDVLLTSFRPSGLAKLGLAGNRIAQAAPGAVAGGDRRGTRCPGRRTRT
jgi:alpha-methylacyl-CoA racemase